jgi:FixJ family two-component response regulator
MVPLPPTRTTPVKSAPLIAIVDDDHAVCVSLDGLMRAYGYRIEMFGSAEAFLASEAAKTAACVVSDVQIEGGMSGIELASRLKAAGPSAPPIFLISAFADEDVQKQAKEAGARLLFKKPFDCCQLIERIEAAMAEGAAQA